MRTRPLAALFALALVAAGCGRCGRTPPQPVELLHHVPAQVQAAIVVPDLAALGERLRLLESLKLTGFAAQLQGLASAQAFGDSIARQAGVDLRNPQSLKDAGVAPERGFAVAVVSADAGYFVVGVADEAAFAATLERIAGDRLGAREEHSKTEGGLRHVWFTRQGSTVHQLGYVLRDGLALVSAGAMGEALPKWAALPRERSLAQDAQFKASLERLPQERDVIVHVPLGPIAAQAGLALTAVAHLDAGGLFIHGSTRWPDSQRTLAMLEAREGNDLVKRLPEDAFAVARYRGDPEALGQVLPFLIGPHLRRAFEQAGLDLQKTVLENLQPGIAVSLSVSPEIKLSGGVPELDVRRTNPFRFVHLVGLAQPRRAEDAAALLERMPAVAPRFGARIEPVERPGQKLYLTRYAQGEGVHLAQAADGRVVFASPLARLERTLGALAAADHDGPPLTRNEDLRAALDAHAVAAVVDLDQLRASVRTLPSDAWGIGGFAMKASALRWLDATDDLRAITVGASRSGDFVRTEVSLRFTRR
jgi:hypothetical protein